MSLEERVRRKLILAGILPKLSNFGQGAIGQAIEAAGAGQFGRLHKEVLKLHDRIRYNLMYSVCKRTNVVRARPKEQKRPGATSPWIVRPRTAFSRPLCEALAIYRQYWEKPLNKKTFGQITLEDFAAFDKAGLTHPDMSRMKQALSDLTSKSPSP